MEYKNTAVLGDLGAPSADGFGADPDTREIQIYDSEGRSVYCKRAKDTAKIADSHISAAGYKRVGEWQDGVATVARAGWFSRSWPALTGIAIVVLLFAGCQGIGNVIKNAPDDPTQNDANYQCRQLVKDQLKAPSTAVFNGESASGGGRSWDASGAVESENTFGGMVQNRYTCDLTYSPSSETWNGTVTFR